MKYSLQDNIGQQILTSFLLLEKLQLFLIEFDILNAVVLLVFFSYITSRFWENWFCKILKEMPEYLV